MNITDLRISLMTQIDNAHDRHDMDPMDIVRALGETIGEVTHNILKDSPEHDPAALTDHIDETLKLSAGDRMRGLKH